MKGVSLAGAEFGEGNLPGRSVGSGGSRIGDEAIGNMLSFIETNDDIWMGCSWWAAGPWWGEYRFTLEPDGNQDRPAMHLLEPWLTPGQNFLPGDYSGNGIVDAADFTIWRDHLGSHTWLPGDTTPGLVSSEDYEVWADFCGVERLPYNVPPVPEPDALVLLGFGCAILALQCRRRGNAVL